MINMKKEDLRIIFLGTPEFAVESLDKLVEGGYNVVATVTMPDKIAGRGHHLLQSDVKKYALEKGLPVLQPTNLKDPAFVEELRSYNADLFIVIAFRMLPEVVWAMQKFGTFNLHASLLPQYRGAAPINWAIINGDTETGVTTFLLNHEIDKGAIIGQVREKIAENDTVGTLYDRLMTIGSDLVLDSVNRIAEGNITPIEQPQSDDNLRPAPKIFKDDCLIDWNKNGVDIVNFVRCLSPYPAAWSRLVKDGSEAGSAKIFEVRFEPKSGITECCRVVTDGKKYMGVTCADGVVYIEDIQIAGKKRLKIKELLLGFRSAEEYRFE